MKETISDRKRKILRCVVDEYIGSATPVSSGTLVGKYLPEVSSATVRSELASLEEQGYLIQLHTSGGRVPSPKAYQMYIDELIKRNCLTDEQTALVRESFERKSTNAENIVKSVADVISELTEYTSVGMSDAGGEIIRNIGLFPCGEGKALLLLVTDIKIRKDNFIPVPEGMTADELTRMSATLQTIFGGRRMDSVREAEAEALNAFTAYRQVCREVLDVLFTYTQKQEVVLSGENRSLQRADYDDVEKVKGFLSLVEDKDKIGHLLADNSQSIQIGLKIGEGEDVPEDCSVVTASYSVGGRQLGTYGVLGPVRMDYAKVVSVLENVRRILEKMLKDE